MISLLPGPGFAAWALAALLDTGLSEAEAVLDDLVEYTWSRSVRPSLERTFPPVLFVSAPAPRREFEAKYYAEQVTAEPTDLNTRPPPPTS
ncbi:MULTISPECIES: hypothetical protein [Streptomyces]|uniref:hypothetical protein n=1 Tax=Streptomyces TaxID=1883 RepID=UPI00081B89F1|nr:MULTISPECIES: hypothetical protein [unclassified Streptomyces]MYQ52280.1 hypothetical protein [Streptomyces sp. SID4941]SCD79446.1 hypothetical protein GA0115247_11409 [Streptomyces sp. PalvLS-984]SDD53721.1 hypothetical protein F558DRAFT_04302 [Streptomyces sp. AmelKG-A3]